MATTASRVATPSSRERDIGTPAQAKWELGWQAPDNMLKIAVFDKKEQAIKRKGATDLLRQKILRMEQSKDLPPATGLIRRRFRSSASPNKRPQSTGKLLDAFRSLVRSVMLLLRCFRMRRKFAVQSGDLTFTHQERMIDLSTPDRCTINLELRTIFSTPPDLRKAEDLQKAASWLRANGTVRAMLGQTSAIDDEKLARYVCYERYESGRLIAHQGRKADRFYYIMTGKILVVNEYHVGNSVISKTVSVLTKGCTTNIEEVEKNLDREQSLVCRGMVEAIAIDKNDYSTLRRDKIGGAKEYLAAHRFFRLFPSSLLNVDTNLLHLHYYPNGSLVFAGGQEYEWIYIIKSGECALVRTQLVSNVRCQKKALFNKQTPEEVGCDRIKSAFEPKADFKMWKRKQNYALWERKPTRFQDVWFSYKDKSEIWDKRFISVKPEIHSVNKKTSFPPIAPVSQSKLDEKSVAEKQAKNRPCSDLDPIDAAMAGVSRKPENGSYQRLLSRTRMTATALRESRDEQLLGHKVGIKSAPPTLRRAHLELGRLKSGDVFGLDDLYGGPDDVTNIALMSKGADVVKLKRRYFLRHAPANLQIQLSSVYHDYPTTGEARASLEANETWSLYKDSLLKLITSGRRPAIESASPETRSSYSKTWKRSVNTSSSLRASSHKYSRSSHQKAFVKNGKLGFVSGTLKSESRLTASAPLMGKDNFQKNFNFRSQILTFKT
ncbi:uncharacterized protein LOC143447295 isoform X2 [Clavelina lepadiformis]